jgi:DNA-binding MarR family transcriptional regulator
MVDRLLEKGMVTRERDANDRRVVLVLISEEGRDFAEKMIDYHLEKMRSMFVEIPRRDREEFLGFLQKIDRQMG